MKLAALALLLSATSALAFPVTVVSCDRDVTFEAAPARAISNDVNLTEMMLVLGLRDRMVGLGIDLLDHFRRPRKQPLPCVDRLDADPHNRSATSRTDNPDPRPGPPHHA